MTDYIQYLKNFQEKKETSLIIADAFRYFGNKKKAERLKECGTSLVIGKHLSGATSLAMANFCKLRLCPMCQWRRSLKLATILTKKIATLEKKNLTPLFLTLTVKNVQGKNLSSCLDDIFKAWSRFIRRKEWKAYVKHSIRTCEVTYNRLRRNYHPHFHILLYVDNSYFASGKPALSNADIARIWQECCKVDYKPIIDIRSVKNSEHYTVAEVAKYCVKSSDIICDTIKQTALVVKTLDVALRNRRLINGTGALKFNVDKELQNLLDEKDIISDPIIKLLFFQWKNDSYKRIEFDKVLEMSYIKKLDEKVRKK